ncbi:hypothetical protein [Stappia sp. 28M-7]|jgi:hypothetical protein|uniref:hypothetical protein n=1 Tax=Stappia sp. 28M-7 TaxID=2762596 RepID=UPI000FF431E5|nr:hypothetical protein [Stappia sp. 28M-7]MBC2859496.1 hypothetical protein [Stappia sp. 28M-7]
MRKTCLTILLAAALPASALAGDIHMISRHSDGSFYGSHKVFTRAGDNLHEISLCGRAYFARAATVAWMNYEAEEGRDVGLEMNQGKGWYRICQDPSKQVKLADIGVTGTNAEVMRASDEAVNRRMRFIYIRQIFSKVGNSGAASSSYHAR